MPLPLLPIALGGLSFLGGLFGNKSKQSTMPNYGPLQGQLLDLIRKRLSSSADLSGYTAQGLQEHAHIDGPTFEMGNHFKVTVMNTSGIARKVGLVVYAQRANKNA